MQNLTLSNVRTNILEKEKMTKHFAQNYTIYDIETFYSKSRNLAYM